MPLPGDLLPPDRDMIMREIADVKREIVELRAARSAEATTIGRAGITISGGFLRLLHELVEIMFVGRDGNNQPIIRLRWPNGQSMFFTYLVTGEDWYFAWTDPQGNVLIASDANSGEGLARPYLSIPSHPRDDQYNFYSTTTNNGFTTVHEVRWVKQHPMINLVMSTKTSDGSSTGEWRIVQGGITVASGTIAASGTPVAVRFPADGGHLAPLNLDIQLRRVTGAGSVGALMKSITGEQS